jgi:hypothetical protein
LSLRRRPEKVLLSGCHTTIISDFSSSLDLVASGAADTPPDWVPDEPEHNPPAGISGWTISE